MTTDFNKVLEIAVVLLREKDHPTPQDISEELQEALRLFPGEASRKDELVRTLEARFNVRIGVGTQLFDNSNHRPWLPHRRSDINWRYWNRYADYLEGEKGWSPAVIESLEERVDTILGFLEDPKREGTWDRRGLVVGNVQSGKTSNYTGLICKAADAGYQLIVVLAGVHNSLRSQTQLRLDEGFLGYNSIQLQLGGGGAHTPVGVGKFDRSCPIPNTITNRADKGDFKKAVAQQFNITPGGNREMSGKEKLRAFDLFCGAGGSSCGARMAGVEVVGGIDIWKDAIDTYKLNYPTSKTYCSDIRRLSARQVAKEVGKIDILLASPECTSHSVARGNKKPCDHSRKTAFEVIRFARAMKPRWIIVENVVSMQRWEQYGDWLERLRKVRTLGYNVIEAKLDASDYGVPQSRRRLLVICDRERGPTLPPKRAGRKCTVKQILEARTTVNGYNFTFSPLKKNGRAKATLDRAQRAINELGKDEPFLIVYYGSDAMGGWQSLDRPLRTITTLDRFALVRPNGSGHEMRMLQPPELAAAMGFPDDYKWVTTCRRNRIKLVGNAVSPLLMKAVIENLIPE